MWTAPAAFAYGRHANPFKPATTGLPAAKPLLHFGINPQNRRAIEANLILPVTPNENNALPAEVITEIANRLARDENDLQNPDHPGAVVLEFDEAHKDQIELIIKKALWALSSRFNLPGNLFLSDKPNTGRTQETPHREKVFKDAQVVADEDYLPLLFIAYLGKRLDASLPEPEFLGRLTDMKAWVQDSSIKKGPLQTLHLKSLNNPDVKLCDFPDDFNQYSVTFPQFVPNKIRVLLVNNSINGLWHSGIQARGAKTPATRSLFRAVCQTPDPVESLSFKKP